MEVHRALAFWRTQIQQNSPSSSELKIGADYKEHWHQRMDFHVDFGMYHMDFYGFFLGGAIYLTTASAALTGWKMRDKVSFKEGSSRVKSSARRMVV